MNYLTVINKYYPAGSLCRGIFLRHSRQVTDKALNIARDHRLDLQYDIIETAAMLHDIGIFLTDAKDIDCHGTEPYIRHGILGAELLREEGFDEMFARVAERHTGAGITNEDIIRQGLPIPPGNYCPETLLEKLICYADKFFSKSGNMEEKSIEHIRHSLSRFTPDTLERFDSMHRMFSAS
ncbi:MAG: HDIG domain-containing protein [Muribaculaceae bacterium]|nr:HDIG domain-containing protein [Muribaculaceae bacterium]